MLGAGSALQGSGNILRQRTGNTRGAGLPHGAAAGKRRSPAPRAARPAAPAEQNLPLSHALLPPRRAAEEPRAGRASRALSRTAEMRESPGSGPGSGHRSGGSERGTGTPRGGHAPGEGPRALAPRAAPRFPRSAPVNNRSPRSGAAARGNPPGASPGPRPPAGPGVLHRGTPELGSAPAPPPRRARRELRKPGYSHIKHLYVFHANGVT